MKRYGSKIWKIRRYGPAESSGTTLRYYITTSRHFFNIKLAPIRSITSIVLLGFLINVPPLNVFHSKLRIIFNQRKNRISYVSEWNNIFYLRSHEIKLVFKD